MEESVLVIIPPAVNSPRDLSLLVWNPNSGKVAYPAVSKQSSRIMREDTVWDARTWLTWPTLVDLLDARVNQKSTLDDWLLGQALDDRWSREVHHEHEPLQEKDLRTLYMWCVMLAQLPSELDTTVLYWEAWPFMEYITYSYDQFLKDLPYIQSAWWMGKMGVPHDR